MEKSTYINQCPDCSKVIYFSHEQTNLLTCTCGTVIHRREDGVLASKPVLRIPDAFGTLQPGSYGRWEGRGFKVLGRFRFWLEESVVNYWTILFDDGDLDYLSEGYGIYSILLKAIPGPAISHEELNVTAIGKQRRLFNENFLLERWSGCSKWEVEGELYLPECDRDLRVYEFSSAGGRHITLIQFSRQIIMAFTTKYTSFRELNVTDTRIDGYPGKTFSCPYCSQPLVVKSYPLANTGACDHCRGGYYFHNGLLKKESRENTITKGPDILMGSSGTVNGIKYQVIGFALKQENNQYRSQWKEYTLFHPDEGFAFLSEYQGHFIFARENCHAPVLPDLKVGSFKWEGEPFQLFNSYHYSVVTISGEFPYNIFKSFDTKVDEFISPPEIWIREKNKRVGITWFDGGHVSREEIEQNFTFPAGIPAKTGVGAVEPKNYLRPEKIVAAVLFGMVCLILVHILMGMIKQHKVLINDTYSFPSDSVHSFSFLAGTFELDKWKSNLEFNLSAMVENSWVEMEAVLVNKETGTEYSIEKGVEYYHGYDEGESWSEGSQEATAYIGQVPSGTYLLHIRAGREGFLFPRVYAFQLKVTYDVNNNINLVYGLLAMLVWPVVTWINISSNEKKRWYNSPFSPYSYED